MSAFVYQSISPPYRIVLMHSTSYVVCMCVRYEIDMVTQRATIKSNKRRNNQLTRSQNCYFKKCYSSQNNLMPPLLKKFRKFVSFAPMTACCFRDSFSFIVVVVVVVKDKENKNQPEKKNTHKISSLSLNTILRLRTFVVTSLWW